MIRTLRALGTSLVLSLAAVAVAAQAPPAASQPPEPFPARIDLIGAEIFGIDQAHSLLEFKVAFLGISTVRGAFRGYAATILWDEERPERSSVTLSIETASIDTGSEFRDKDLQSAKFFDAEKYPRIRFQSTAIEPQGGDRYLVRGDLTIKEFKRAIAIPMTRTLRRVPDTAWGNIRIGVAGTVTLRRQDFGLVGNDFWGDKTIAQDVEVTLEILGSRSNYDRWGFQSQPKPSIGEVVWAVLQEHGAEAAAARFRELKSTAPEAYNFGPGQLGIVVNRVMQRRRASEALILILAGHEAYPDEPGFYARAGEAHAVLGHRDEAVRAYEKAHALSPEGTEAIEMLRRLRP